MTSARNYWSTDDLWSDFQYWRWRQRQMRSRPGWGVTHVDINIAGLHAQASYDVLCKRRPTLRSPDEAAVNAVEGRTWFKRPMVSRT